MKIGIDISQLAYETGVSNYLRSLVRALIENDRSNEYILFYASLRNPFKQEWLGELPRNVSVKKIKIPPTALTKLWNTLHIIPLEKFVGDVDVFITSDWTEPRARKAKKVTIIYDLIVYKYPDETHNSTEVSAKRMQVSANIVKEQMRRLHWVKKESDHILAISEATKRDIIDILKIPAEKISVIYPGISL